MPHECTSCGRTFPDGSKEMLSGCPDCGGNKFQFAPAGQDDDADFGAADTGGTDAATDDADGSDSLGTVERAADAVRGWVTADSDGGAATGVDRDAATGSAGAESDAADGTPVADDGRSTPTDRGRASTDDRGAHAEGDRRSAVADRGDDSKPWPSSDDRQSSTAAESDAGSTTFDEWPETARRPEDRTSTADETDSTATNASTGETSGSPSSGAGPTAGTADGDASGSRPADDGSIMADSEDAAQADARSELASTNELPTEPVDGSDGAGDGPSTDEQSPPEGGRVVSEPSDDQPSLEELREELNEQFESIKIVSPGQYELNLMELYNREEYIISLQEDGRYVIDVPDSWREDDDGE